jgi:hypothetical protein
MSALRVAAGFGRLPLAGRAELNLHCRNAGTVAMPQPPNVYMLGNMEIQARCECRSCGKVRELGPDELHTASDMDSLAHLARRFRCSGCGKKEISIEPIWHSDWMGG